MDFSYLPGLFLALCSRVIPSGAHKLYVVFGTEPGLLELQGKPLKAIWYIHLLVVWEDLLVIGA